jgi:hypothetical protein
MEVSPLFLKARAWAFSLITLLSLVWITLLSVEAFTRWNLSGQPEKSFLVLFLLINFISVIMLPVLLIIRFRAWLDGARMGLLLLAHVGIAAAYSFWFPQFQCASDNGDEDGVCELVNMYTLIACWVNPLLLIAYTACLSLMVYRRRMRLAAEAQNISTDDLETMRTRGSALPIMLPDEDWRGSVRTSRPLLSERNSSQPTLNSEIKYADKSQRPPSSRLSKPLPASYL